MIFRVKAVHYDFAQRNNWDIGWIKDCANSMCINPRRIAHAEHQRYSVKDEYTGNYKTEWLTTVNVAGHLLLIVEGPSYEAICTMMHDATS